MNFFRYMQKVMKVDGNALIGLSNVSEIDEKIFSFFFFVFMSQISMVYIKNAFSYQFKKMRVCPKFGRPFVHPSFHLNVSEYQKNMKKNHDGSK